MSDEPTKEWTYREATLGEVLEWFQGKTVANDFVDDWVGTFAYGIELSDGSRVVASSHWTDSSTPTTPDVDADPPKFWIGEPAQ